MWGKTGSESGLVFLPFTSYVPRNLLKVVADYGAKNPIVMIQFTWKPCIKTRPSCDHLSTCWCSVDIFCDSFVFLYIETFKVELFLLNPNARLTHMSSIYKTLWYWFSLTVSETMYTVFHENIIMLCRVLKYSMMQCDSHKHNHFLSNAVSVLKNPTMAIVTDGNGLLSSEHLRLYLDQQYSPQNGASFNIRLSQGVLWHGLSLFLFYLSFSVL